MTVRREISFKDDATTPTTRTLEATKDTKTKDGFLDDMEMKDCDLSEGSQASKEILKEILQNLF